MAKPLRFSVVYHEILTKSCEEFSYVNWSAGFEECRGSGQVNQFKNINGHQITDLLKFTFNLSMGCFHICSCNPDPFSFGDIRMLHPSLSHITGAPSHNTAILECIDMNVLKPNLASLCLFKML